MCSFTLSGCTGTNPDNSSSGSDTHLHNYIYVRETAPTCVKDGVKEHYECSLCGQLFDAEKEETTLDALTIEKLGHLSGTEWFEEDGYHYHLCDRCGVKVDVESHTLNRVEGTEADHDHQGSLNHYECEICHKSFLDEDGKISLNHTSTHATGHDNPLAYHPEVAATCEVDGTEAYYSCSCGALFKDAKGLIRIENPRRIPALGHVSYGILHSNDTKHWHTCYRCGENFEEEIHTAGQEVFGDAEHTWNLCTVCGHKVNIQDRSITGCQHNRVMYFEKLSPTFSKPGHIAYYYCCDCQKCFYDSGCVNEIPNCQYGATDIRDGRYVSPLTGIFSILNSNLKDYLDAKTDQEVVAALRNNEVKNYQAKKTVFWEDNNNGPYEVDVASLRSFSDKVTYQTSVNAYTFKGSFTPGEVYYYRVKDASGNYIVNDYSFKIDDSRPLRTVTIDGVYNVRDLGGWTAKDGHKVKYGKLYRGANLENITTEGVNTLLGTLGVKTEIDLRGDSPSHDLVDPRLNYLNYPIWMYTSIIPEFAMTYPDGPSVGFEAFQIPNIKSIFETLADDSNYPIYYHCAVGADRTGTISYLINGLLGVEYEDLTRDFEITSFSVAGDRYRSFVNEDDTFNPIGVYENDDGNWMGWGKMNTVMQFYYGEEGQPLYKAIENYLKEVCEVSDETIAAVRRNLLGADVEF